MFKWNTSEMIYQWPSMWTSVRRSVKYFEPIAQLPTIEAIVEVGHKLKRSQAGTARGAIRAKAATTKTAA
jgi:hypothetical protein